MKFWCVLFFVFPASVFASVTLTVSPFEVSEKALLPQAQLMQAFVEECLSNDAQAVVVERNAAMANESSLAIGGLKQGSAPQWLAPNVVINGVLNGLQNQQWLSLKAIDPATTTLIHTYIIPLPSPDICPLIAGFMQPVYDRFYSKKDTIEAGFHTQQSQKLQEAIVHINNQKPLAALPLLLDLQRAHPSNPEPRYWLVKAYLQANERTLARLEFQELRERFPGNTYITQLEPSFTVTQKESAK
jgi:hypothetical protein